MPFQLITAGTGGDVKRIGDYEGYFEEGAKGYIELELRSQIAVDIIGWLDDKLDAIGVPASAVEVKGRYVYISFEKGIAPLVLIAGAIAATIFLIALIVAWKLFKLSPEVVAGLTTGVILLIIGGVLLVLFLIATRGRLLAGPVQVGG